MIDFSAPILDDAHHRRRMLVGMTEGREAVAAFDRARGNSFENITFIEGQGGTFLKGCNFRPTPNVAPVMR